MIVGNAYLVQQQGVAGSSTAVAPQRQAEIQPVGVASAARGGSGQDQPTARPSGPPRRGSLLDIVV